jgi:hypothetical protein
MSDLVIPDRDPDYVSSAGGKYWFRELICKPALLDDDGPSVRNLIVSGDYLYHDEVMVDNRLRPGICEAYIAWAKEIQDDMELHFMSMSDE